MRLALQWALFLSIQLEQKADEGRLALLHSMSLVSNAQFSESGEADGQAALGALLRRLFHHDLNVAAQLRQASEQPPLGGAAKLSAKQPRNFGLMQPEEFRRLFWCQSPLADDLRYFCDQLRLDQHVFAIGKAQVGVHISRALFD